MTAKAAKKYKETMSELILARQTGISEDQEDLLLDLLDRFWRELSEEEQVVMDELARGEEMCSEHY